MKGDEGRVCLTTGTLLFFIQPIFSMTPCSCAGSNGIRDGSGAPQDVYLYQAAGVISMTWKDNSMCEEVRVFSNEEGMLGGICISCILGLRWSFILYLFFFFTTVLFFFFRGDLC